MLTTDERKKIQKMLYHGSSIIIAEKAGVSKIAVSKWFNGQTNSEIIENAVIDLFIESRLETERKLQIAGFL